MLEFPTLDLSPFDRFGLTPLDDAIRHGHVPVQKLPAMVADLKNQPFVTGVGMFL